MNLKPGLFVGRNVRLKRLLGEGGMGSVWVGDHLTLHTEVAVKFISANIAEKPEAMARFSREATAAAQIKSPHVVQIFDHGVMSEKIPFIVMELLEGEGLGARIARSKQLELAELVQIVGQVGKALQRAHALGIVHRDIKPDNIFLTEADDEVFVKVLDFGIAKHVDASMDMTSTGSMVGTPYYMSPEQVLSAKAVDFHSDLWSLAVVTYYALTGRLPFTAETLGALCIAIEKAKFAPPSSVRPDLPASLDSWFARALARNPTDRFESAKEMADSLRAVADGKALPARASSAEPKQNPAPVPAPREVEARQSSTSVMPPAPAVPETLMEATITRGTAPPRILYAAVGSAVGLGIFLVAGGFLLGRARSQSQPQIEAILASSSASEPAAQPSPDELSSPAASSSDGTAQDSGAPGAASVQKQTGERSPARERNEPAKKNEKPKPKSGSGEPDYGF